MMESPALDTTAFRAPAPSPPGPSFADAAAVAAALDGELPVLLARPQAAAAAAARFHAGFPGRTFYALKANPAPWLTATALAHGVDGVEVASAAEAMAAQAIAPAAPLAFMHPVKPRAGIARAFHEARCRVFALDHEGEWAKLQGALGAELADCDIIVRLAVSNEGAAMPLLDKFGATPEEAVALLQAARRKARRVGVSFHVGSQNLRPQTFEAAIATAGAVARRAGGPLDILNVGGGFPAAYPGMTPAPLETYFAAIGTAAARLRERLGAFELWCEPGRALAAGAHGLLATVELRKGRRLYLNDGGSGALYDAVHCGWRFPIRAFRDGAPLEGAAVAYEVFGPTCDSDDVLAHPLQGPEDLREGDRIEFGLVGAYGAAMASGFNGFGRFRHAVVADDPWPAMAAAGPAAPAAVR